MTQHANGPNILVDITHGKKKTGIRSSVATTFLLDHMKHLEMIQ